MHFVDAVTDSRYIASLRTTSLLNSSKFWLVDSNPGLCDLSTRVHDAGPPDLIKPQNSVSQKMSSNLAALHVSPSESEPNKA